MEFWISYRTYNGGGGFFEGAIVGDVLEDQQVFCGNALEEIEFLLCFKRRNPADKTGVKKSLLNMHEQFHNSFCNTLPYRRFERNKKRLVITTIADFAVAQELRHTQDGKEKIYRAEWVEAILNQLILEVSACRNKFKSSDDFDFDTFLNSLKASCEHLPKDKARAEKLRAESQERFNLKRSKMSDWEKLHIDWEDFHAKSREIVPNPKLWSCVDDFSPNGNDAGADILEAVRDTEFKLPITLDKLSHSYRSVLSRFGIEVVSTADDSIEYSHYRESVIGLTFAYLKLRGVCPAWLIEISTSEIEKYCIYLNTNQLDWTHREEALEYQSMMKDCLTNYKRLNQATIPKGLEVEKFREVKSTQELKESKQRLGFWKKIFNSSSKYDE